MQFGYSITKELLQALVDIGNLEEKLKKFSIPFSLRTALIKDVKVRTSHFSNKIEGNCLTLKQSDELSEGKKVDAPSRDIQEVKNLFDLFDFMIDESNNKTSITTDLICEIHRYVEKNIVKGKLLGHYREAQNAIFDSSTKKIVYMPPEVKDVSMLMGQFINLINDRDWEHALIKAAVAHFGLVTIHPFMDGNGRTARALSTFLLMQEGLYFVRYMAWDEYFYRHRSEYYQILHDIQGDNFYKKNEVWDIQRWLVFFISGVEQMIEYFLEEMGSIPSKAILNRRQEKVLRYLKRNTKITNREYCKLNRVSNFTARADLRTLEEQSLVKRIGEGRSVEYVLK